MPGCPTENEFFESSEGAAILMTTIQDQVYLLAWNGVQWSEPQVQIVLSGFKDPETNSLVTLSCRKAASGGENRLYYTGCDPDGTEDIWITDRPIGSTSDWFPPEPAGHLLRWPVIPWLFYPAYQRFNRLIHVFGQEDRLDSGICSQSTIPAVKRVEAGSYSEFADKAEHLQVAMMKG
jgi:hypothetical protein